MKKIIKTFNDNEIIIIIKRNFKTLYDKKSFSFKASIDEWIVLFAFLIIPFISNCFYSAGILYDKSNNNSLLIQSIIPIIFGLIAILFLSLKNGPGYILQSGILPFILYFFVMHIILPFIIAPIITSFWQNPTNSEKITYEINGIVVLCQCVLQIVIIGIVLVFMPDLRKKYIAFFNVKKVLIYIIIGLLGFLITLLLNFIFTSIYNVFFLNINNSLTSSSNESTIDNILKYAPYSFIYMYLLIILVGPLTEELCTRYSIFKFFKNKILAIFTSILFFAAMHTETDMEHIFLYLGAGFGFTIIYIIGDLYTKNGVVCSSLSHIIFNIAASI